MDYKITSFAVRDEDADVIEYWQQIQCLHPDGCLIEEAFSVHEKVADPIAKVNYFISGWGREYSPKTIGVTEKVHAGRMESLVGLRGQRD